MLKKIDAWAEREYNRFLEYKQKSKFDDPYQDAPHLAMFYLSMRLMVRLCHPFISHGNRRKNKSGPNRKPMGKIPKAKKGLGN